MLKPSVQVQAQDNVLFAEFWDCVRLDPLPVQDLRKHYETHLRNGGRPELVVDMCGVGFAGSSALGIFVGLHRFARQNGGRLIFCQVEPTVRDVFRASQLESLFEFVEDRAAALRSIARGERMEEADRRKRGIPLSNDVADADGAVPSNEHTGIGRFRRRRESPGPKS